MFNYLNIVEFSTIILYDSYSDINGGKTWFAQLYLINLK